MHTIFLQFLKIWKKTNIFQKLLSILILCGIGGTLFYTIFKSSSSYAPLFKNPLSSADAGAVRSYLEHFSIPFKEMKEKGIAVPEEHADRIRLELLEANIPKQSQVKGFELFDTNTWIKGEKELQVLEMRALKGQLEKDLAGFEQIKNASVILDIPPQRSFANSPYKTKASCILTLMPGAKLSNSQLIAITNHLAGAVRGLEPNMIAISDTTGKLYKAIDPKAKELDSNYKYLLIEDEAKEKIDHFLSKVIGKEKYLSSINAFHIQEAEKPSLKIGIIIDENWVLEEKGEKELIREKTLSQLTSLVKGFDADVEINLDFAAFEKKSPIATSVEKTGGYLGFFITSAITLLALFCSFFFFKNKPEKKNTLVDDLSFSKVDLHRLVESMKNENPRTIAMMISYLEPHKAERLIAAFPEKMQEAILIELEREEI